MKFCYNCGTEIEEGDKFCIEFGADFGLVDVEEIQKYMPDEESRRALPTKYCGTNGGFMEIDGVVYGAWWTRSFVEVDGEIGMIPIGANGFINIEGFGPTEDIGVRPAVWIDTSKIN